jgi:hypothetical protein
MAPLSLVETFAELDARQTLTHAAAAGDAETTLICLSEALRQHPGAMVLAMYWDTDRQRVGFGLIEPGRWQYLKLPGSNPHAARGYYFVPVGDPDVAEQLLKGAAIPWSSLTLDDVVQLARFAVATTIDLRRFEASEALVGGQISTGVVTADGARILTRPTIELRDYGLARVA